MPDYDLQNKLKQTEKYVAEHFRSEGSGHDWWHIYRVKNLALKIATKENGNLFLIEMAALLHDLDDWKLRGDSVTSLARDWLVQIGTQQTEIQQIEKIIGEVSFKGAGVVTPASSLEAKIVQDADRLDAIGAIGIARAFAYGGNKQRLIYDPTSKPEFHSDFSAYKKSNSSTINHFYEKLLLLKDRLNTQTAKEIAEKRHQFMVQYLEQFFEEWENRS